MGSKWVEDYCAEDVYQEDMREFATEQFYIDNDKEDR